MNACVLSKLDKSYFMYSLVKFQFSNISSIRGLPIQILHTEVWPFSISFQQESLFRLSWHKQNVSFQAKHFSYALLPIKLHSWIWTKILPDWQFLFLPALLCSKRDLNVSVIHLFIKYPCYLKNNLCDKIKVFLNPEGQGKLRTNVSITA